MYKFSKVSWLLRMQSSSPWYLLATPMQLPHFSAYVYCGQTAGWIKMPLGTEMRRPRPRPQICGRWRPSCPPAKKQRIQIPSIFGPCLLWPKHGKHIIMQKLQTITAHGSLGTLVFLCQRSSQNYNNYKSPSAVLCWRPTIKCNHKMIRRTLSLLFY